MSMRGELAENSGHYFLESPIIRAYQDSSIETGVQNVKKILDSSWLILMSRARASLLLCTEQYPSGKGWGETLTGRKIAIERWM